MGTLSPPLTESLQDTLRGMDLFDLISRSFSSNKLSTHLKSLNILNARIHVQIGVGFPKPLRIKFRASHVSAKLEISPDPTWVKVVGVIHTMFELHDKRLPTSFLDVFNKPNIDVFYHSENGDLNGDNLLKDIPIREFMCQNLTKPHKMMHHVSNSTKSLWISAELPPCSSAHQLLAKNFKKLTAQFPVFDLNSLLSMTTPIIEIRSTKRISENDLNLFLRHWMYGVSNCLLKYLDIRAGHGTTDLNGEAIGKGIWCQKQAESLRRICKFKDPVSGDLRITLVYGGYNIQRNDGVRATFNYSSGSFYFIVWD